MDFAVNHSNDFPSVVDDITQNMRTNCMGFASFTILIWDHIDTFTTEVEYIWKGKKGPIVYLFLVNRYLTPFGFIVNLFAYLSPMWTRERCSRFIRFEGSMTMIGITIVGMMMLLRVNALYYNRRWVVSVVAFFLLFQTCMNGWLLTRGEAVVHNPESGVRACTMIFDPSISVLASSSAWLPLLYDTMIVTLTLAQTIPALRHRKMSFVMRRLLEDGLIYYSAIFSVTLVLTIMIIAAPPGLKNITAQLELLLTVAMMSRITLNLKKSAGKASTNEGIIYPSIVTNNRITFAKSLNARAEIASAVPMTPLSPASAKAVDVSANSFAISDHSKGGSDKDGPYSMPSTWR